MNLPCRSGKVFYPPNACHDGEFLKSDTLSWFVCAPDKYAVVIESGRTWDCPICGCVMDQMPYRGSDDEVEVLVSGGKTVRVLRFNPGPSHTTQEASA